MATPVAHSLVGLALAVFRRPAAGAGRGAQAAALLAAALLANAPDLDYLYGLAAGAPNRYHQTVTHTVAWIAAVALAAGAVDARRAGWPAARAAAGYVFLLLASHLLLDWLTADRSPPVGLMAAWPVSDRLWHAPVSVFPAAAKQSWRALISAGNLRVVLAEMAWTAPLLLAACGGRRRRLFA